MKSPDRKRMLLAKRALLHLLCRSVQHDDGGKMTTSMRMVHWAVLLAAAIVAVSLAYAGQNSSASNAKPADSGDSLPLGDWRGDSICVVRESACHDEKSLYHVARLPDKPGWVSIRLDKIVDGKPVTMGAEDCRYDA